MLFKLSMFVDDFILKIRLQMFAAAQCAMFTHLPNRNIKFYCFNSVLSLEIHKAGRQDYKKKYIRWKIKGLGPVVCADPLRSFRPPLGNVITSVWIIISHEDSFSSFLFFCLFIYFFCLLFFCLPAPALSIQI